MRKVFILILLLICQYSYSQISYKYSFGKIPYANHKKCLDLISKQKEQAQKDLEDKWYESDPNPNAGVFACENHCPKSYCRKHKKQCENWCDCAKYYKQELEALESKFKIMENECESTLKRELKAENDKFEQERKAAEEERQVKVEKEKKEKERIEEERQVRLKKEKMEKEKAEKEKTDKEKTDKEKVALKNSKSNSDTANSKSTSSSSSSTYVESERDIEMKERAEAQRKKDANEDKVMGAAMTGVVTAMGAAMGSLLEQDDDDDRPIYLDGTIGLGLQQVPITNNMTYGAYNYNTGVTTYNKVSQIGSTNNYTINAGLRFALLNDKLVSLRLSPFFSYGMNAFENGTSGNHISYGSGAALGFGRNIKLLVKGEFVKRSGSLTTDDATIGIYAKGYSNYNYSSLKYGIGAYLGLGGHNSFAEASVYKENISFLKSINAEVYSYEAKVSFALLALAVQYAPNYPIAGKVEYPGTYKKEKEDLLILTLYVPFKIFSND